MRRLLRDVAALGLALSFVISDPAGAARGFSWYEPPFLTNLVDAAVVRARWHVDYGDPRCPNREDLDAYPDAHACVGDHTVLGIVYTSQTLIVRGVGEATSPEDDYSAVVTAPCQEEREPALTNAAYDYWQAVWVQQMWHRTDHHQPNPHGGNVVVEFDVRKSAVTQVPRCRQGQLTR